jgi:hypothetical protein
MNPNKKLQLPSFPTSCPRCEGFIVPERLWDVQGTCDPLWVPAIRCTNCGFIVGSHSNPTAYKRPQRRPRRHTAQQVVPIRSDPAN